MKPCNFYFLLERLLNERIKSAHWKGYYVVKVFLKRYLLIRLCLEIIKSINIDRKRVSRTGSNWS